MRTEHIFFSQYICCGGLLSAQCFGDSITPMQAARRFGIQEECMRVAMEALLNDNFNEMGN